jgi:oligopeptide transport system permease protein
MLRHILVRTTTAVPTLLAVLVLAFVLMRLAPGGPFDADRALDPEIAANLRRIYRLDLPLHEQFWFYLTSLLHGDLGPSLHWRDFSVNELFAIALPVSMRLGAAAMLLALVLGSALGLAGAASRGGVLPRIVDAVSMTGLVLPAFVIAPLLQLLFGLTLRWLPVGGWNDGALRNQILPVLTLALPQIAIVAQLTQAGMRETLALPHIRTLRAFGLPAWHIHAHALRAAVLPVVSYLGLAAANILTGSVVVETIFGIPGMGRYFVDGALGRDYTLVMGTVVVVAVLVVLFDLVVDILYSWLDPRVRLGTQRG